MAIFAGSFNKLKSKTVLVLVKLWIYGIVDDFAVIFA
jgi:hypothetical protein